MAALWPHLLDDLVAVGDNLDQVLESLARRIGETFSAAGGVFILGPDGVLRLRAAWDSRPERVEDIRSLLQSFPADSKVGPLATAVREKRPVLVADQPDLRPQFRTFAAEHAMVGALLLPLLGDDGVIGVLAVVRFGQQTPFTQDETAQLEQVSLLVAQIVRVGLLIDRRRMADVALAGMTEAVAALDQYGSVTFWNSGAEHLYGYSADEVVGQSAREILASTQTGSDGKPLDPQVVQQELVARGVWAGRIQQRRRDGSPLTVHSIVSSFVDAAGDAGVVIVNRDITAEIAAEAELRRQQALAQSALDSSPMGVGVFDQTGTVVACSRVWLDRMGPLCGVGASGDTIVRRLVADPDVRARLLESFEAVIADGQPRSSDDYEVDTAAGLRTFSVHIAAVAGIGATVTIADVTERAARERAWSYSATHDGVTRLPNRGVLLDRAAHALTRASRQRGQVGLLYCDLDGFKELNDRYGHGAGDDVLETVAARLKEACRATDTVARIGGDEFVILLEDAVDDASVRQVAARIVARAAAPLSLPVGDLTVTTSVGALLITPESDRTYGETDVTIFLDQADAAMYEAKRLGRNRWVMFDEALHQRQQNQGALVGDLVRGTRNGEFLLHFQPQFDSSGLIAGAEALLRWDHPERGIVEPIRLLGAGGSLPLAIGDWALGQAAATVQRWEPRLRPGFRMGVALSRAQWLDRNTSDVLLDWLSRTGVKPHRFRVQVSQDSLTAHFDHSVAMAERLADSGVDVAVTGFGAGSMPLMELARLRLGSAILSRSVIRELGRVPAAESVLRAMVTMHRGLGWQTVVTGVESDEQLAAVVAVHPALIQGYGLGRPAPSDEFESRWL